MAVDWGLALQQTGKEALGTIDAFNAGQAATLKRNEMIQQRNARAAAAPQIAAGNYDQAASTALQGGDINYAEAIGKLGGDHRKQLADEADALGSVAYGLKQLPPDQRAAAFQQAIPALKARGFSDQELAAGGQDLSDGALDGHINTAQSVKDMVAAHEKANEPTTTQRELASAGIVPGDPRYAEAVLGHVNPSQFMSFGSDATGRQLIQTRGMTGGGGPVSGGAPSGSGGAPISIQNNNPGALRPDGKSQWQGATPGAPGGFLAFDTPENGRRAQIINLQNQARLHGINTLAALTEKYAPQSDGNDPNAYAARIGAALGVDPNAPINLADPQIASRVADAMAAVESGGSPARGESAPQAQAGGGPRVVMSTPPVAESDTVSLDPHTVEYLAQNFVATGGSLPPLGRGRQATALLEAIITRAAQIAQGNGQNGADLALGKADYKSGGTSLTQQSKMLNAVRANETTANKNMQLFMEASKKVPGQTDYPLLNRVMQAGAYASGNADVAAMRTASEVFAQEYGKAISGSGNGSAALSDSAAAHARSVIDQAGSPKQKIAAMQTLTKDMHNRIEAFEQGIDKIRGQIRNGGGGGSAPRKIANAAEYRALPSGTVFLDPTGVKRKKP